MLYYAMLCYTMLYYNDLLYIEGPIWVDRFNDRLLIPAEPTPSNIHRKSYFKNQVLYVVRIEAPRPC